MRLNEFAQTLTESLAVGDPVIITGNVEYQGKTGNVREIGRDGAFVVVDLYNYGPQSFQASDVEYNDYADEEDADDVVERAMTVPDNNAASAKKLYQYVARNLQDLASNASFEVKRFNRPYHEDKFNGFFKDSSGNPVKVLFGLNGKIEFENGALYIPVGIYYQYSGFLHGSTFVSNVLNALENQDVAEGNSDWSGSQGRFAGDVPVDLGGAVSKRLDVGDVVSYFGEKATIRAMSKDRTVSRIDLKSGITQNVKTSDLKRVGQGVAEQERVGNMPADKFDAAMARLKQLAGAGPLKTVWDPQKRVYRNVPTAVQPKK
jgi:hypothetical protein